MCNSLRPGHICTFVHCHRDHYVQQYCHQAAVSLQPPCLPHSGPFLQLGYFVTITEIVIVLCEILLKCNIISLWFTQVWITVTIHSFNSWAVFYEWMYHSYWIIYPLKDVQEISNLGLSWICINICVQDSKWKYAFSSLEYTYRAQLLVHAVSPILGFKRAM